MSVVHRTVINVPDEESHEPTIGGSGAPGVYGPAFVSTQESWSFSGAVELRRPVVEPAVVFQSSGILVLSRRRTFVFAGQRDPATRVVMARCDDDELLLLL